MDPSDGSSLVAKGNLPFAVREDLSPRRAEIKHTACHGRVVGITKDFLDQIQPQSVLRNAINARLSAGVNSRPNGWPLIARVFTSYPLKAVGT
jgi:hypothetical protein